MSENAVGTVKHCKNRAGLLTVSRFDYDTHVSFLQLAVSRVLTLVEVSLTDPHVLRSQYL